MTERVEHLAEGVSLYLGDCRTILPTLGKVDAVVTSPPYAQQRDYGAPIGDWMPAASMALILGCRHFHRKKRWGTFCAWKQGREV